MSKTNPTCIVCGVELNNVNWYRSQQKKRYYICKECTKKRCRSWRKANPEIASRTKSIWRKNNPEKQRAQYTRDHRKQGHRPFNENKNCTMFLGVHVAEGILSKVFKNVERMPIHNHGYDFICNHGKKIDVKSSCLWNSNRWGFEIKHNTVADYFLCLAFDDREDLTPMYMWLIPSDVVKHLKSATISPSTIHKWDAYKLDISKVAICCNEIKNKCD